jgi:tripartite-type tricarboxylate transporter receptor subunit TctC
MAISRIVRRFSSYLLLAGVAFAAPSFANDDRLIKSQTITMMIAAGPGSGYDTYGRLAARHLGRFLPGHPTIVPMNMPGADGLQGATWLYQSAPKDGSAIGILENSTPFEPLLKKIKTPIDPLKISWLGSLNRIANIALVWNTSSIKTTDEMFSREIIVGATSGNSDSVSMPKLLNKMIGTKFKIVTGYGSSNEIVLAMDRGEVEGALGISSDSLEGPFGAQIASHKMRILMQIDAEKFDDKLLNSVPSVMDYVKSPDDRQVLRLILAKLEYGRPFAAPPDLPAPVLEQLRKAFADMSADPMFQADAAKMGVPTHFSSGNHIAQSIAALYKTPRAIVDEASAIMGGSSDHP